MQGSREIGGVFNEMSEDYTSVMDTMVPFYRKLLTSIIELLPPDLDVKKMLDLGPGNGNIFALCVDKFPNASAHFVDASEDMIEICRKRFPDADITFEIALFQDLKLPESSYELVTAGFSFHHLKANEKQQVLSEVYNALVPGGAIGVVDLFIDTSLEPAHSEFMNRWKHFVLKNNNTLEDWEWLVDHYYKYDNPESVENYTKMLRNAGFGVVNVSWKSGPWVCMHAIK